MNVSVVMLPIPKKANHFSGHGQLFEAYEEKMASPDSAAVVWKHSSLRESTESDFTNCSFVVGHIQPAIIRISA